MTGPIARLLVARAAALDAARAMRCSAQESGTDVDHFLQLAARLDRVADELYDVEGNCRGSTATEASRTLDSSRMRPLPALSARA